MSLHRRNAEGMKAWPALVLTAGLATRLQPLSSIRAKAALPLPRSEMAWATATAGRMHVVGGYGEGAVNRAYHHIYDPAVSVWEAYRVLFGQWRLAFEIGAANRVVGARPMALRALVRLALSSKLNRSPRQIVDARPLPRLSSFQTPDPKMEL